MNSVAPIHNSVPLSAVLFDLDGTLLDTAPDLAHAFNQLRISHALTPLPLDIIRHYAGTGSKDLLKYSFELSDNDEKMQPLLNAYYDFYEKNLIIHTQLFQGMTSVLDFLELKKIPWGIVTNKVSRFTHPLVQHFKFKTPCVVCSDTLNILKPNPEPLLYACEQLQVLPQQVLYVGDTQIDVHASKAANMMSAVALYGYIQKQAEPAQWQADYYLSQACDLIPILQTLLSQINTHE